VFVLVQDSHAHNDWDSSGFGETGDDGEVTEVSGSGGECHLILYTQANSRVKSRLLYY